MPAPPDWSDPAIDRTTGGRGSGAVIGIAPVRTPLAHDLLAVGPAAVRANASEVLALTRGGPGGRGADSTVAPEDAANAARALAGDHRCVVAVSGASDLVTDGRRTVRITNGSPALPRVTGTGCLLGGLTAALLATAGEEAKGVTPFASVVAATALLTVAADRVGDLRPGSFKVALLDALDEVTADEVGREMMLTCE